MRKQTIAHTRSSKLRGGYTTLDLIGKGKSVEVFYRLALDAELMKFLRVCFKQIERVYTTVPVNNANYVDNPDRKPSVFSVEYVIRQLKTTGLDTVTDNSNKIVLKFVKKALRFGKKTARKALDDAGLKAMTIHYDKAYDDMMRLFVQRNVALIRNTTEQTLTNIENIVFDGMTRGQGWQDIYNNLETQKHITKDRVKRIARDQTAKATETLNELMQRDAGIEYFEWDAVIDSRTSRGEGGHLQLNGKIYKYGEESRYPVIDTYGHRGLPAQRPNCRCRAKGVIIYQGYEARWNKSKKSYEIIKVR